MTKVIEFNRYSFVDPTHYEESPVETIPIWEQIETAWDRYSVGGRLSDDELHLLHGYFLELFENPVLIYITEYKAILRTIIQDYLRLDKMLWRRKNPL